MACGDHQHIVRHLISRPAPPRPSPPACLSASLVSIESRLSNFNRWQRKHRWGVVTGQARSNAGVGFECSAASDGSELKKLV